METTKVDEQYGYTEKENANVAGEHPCAGGILIVMDLADGKTE